MRLYQFRQWNRLYFAGSTAQAVPSRASSSFCNQFRVCAAFCTLLLLSRPDTSAQTAVQLGSPPTAPRDVSGLPHRIEKSLVSSGFTVNTTNREEVRSFFNAIYPASDNVLINSTANIGACTAGTNSIDFQDSVIRRINWFRAM